MTKSIVIVAMYKFVRLDNHEAMQPIVLSFCQQREIYGTLLLAEEGLNGTLAGTRSAIDALLVFLKSVKIWHLILILQLNLHLLLIVLKYYL